LSFSPDRCTQREVQQQHLYFSQKLKGLENRIKRQNKLTNNKCYYEYVSSINHILNVDYDGKVPLTPICWTAFQSITIFGNRYLYFINILLTPNVLAQGKSHFQSQ